MRKEAEILLNQFSEVASKIQAVSDYSEIEKLIPIYLNFFDQITLILKEDYLDDVASKLQEINLKVQEHLTTLKLQIKQEISKENIKQDMSNKFNLKIVERVIDKKV